MKNAVFTLSIFLFLACNKIRVFNNAPEDMQLARKAANKFYQARIDNDTSSICNALYSSINREDLKDVLSQTKILLGDIKSIKINNIETLREMRDDTLYKAEYLISLNIQYENNENEEQIGFVKEGNAIINLFSFTSKSLDSK